MGSAVGTVRAMEILLGMGIHPHLWLWLLLCVRLWLFSLSHRGGRTEQKVAQAEGPEVVLLQQCCVSMLLAAGDLLRAFFKHGVTAEQLALEHK